MTADQRGGLPRIAIVGLGLIGGSLAKLLRGAHYRVSGWDPDGVTRERASEIGVTILSGLDDPAWGVADLVVLAVPLRAIRGTAAALAPTLGAHTVVTDVGSVKGPVREAMHAAGLSQRYVGAHPMAGTELSGFGASSSDLLRGARWAVTLDESTSLAGFLLVSALITETCGGSVIPLSDEVHDEAAALISHVPHVLATELLNIVAHSPIRAVATGLAAGSFRDGTRVARTTPRRTQAMVTDNAAWVAAALRVASRDLEALANDLESNAPTDDFFDRADVLRGDLAETAPENAARSEQFGEVSSVLALGDAAAWYRDVIAVGTRGARIVAVNADDASVVISEATAPSLADPAAPGAPGQA